MEITFPNQEEIGIKKSKNIGELRESSQTLKRKIIRKTTVFPATFPGMKVD